MRTKLTITIDQDLIPLAKEYAHLQGLSLSRLVERYLTKEVLGSSSRESFSQRWRGRFKPSEHSGDRYKVLSKKYL